MAARAGAFDPAGPLSVPGGVSGTSHPALSGQVVAVAIAVSTGSASPVLESASLIPVPGFPTPTLAHLGTYYGRGYPVTALDWPPRDPGSGGEPPAALPISAFQGFQLQPAHTVNGFWYYDTIYFGIVGEKTGVDYYAAGLRVTYRVGSIQYTTNLYQMGVDCVRADPQKQ